MVRISHVDSIHLATAYTLVESSAHAYSMELAVKNIVGESSSS